eukprot:CAMPEP_0178829908 /NCGR_PEP_ID=MMETSP0746-20121128/8620_1 /TAXON_ID=913974 /ORGANISM="Nitzschia punctata, Strain CCMP561" /LENGTH=564 /DNA_ID=CAMNT_0020491999 /DNA_START=47 /DNA_END=1741 /DNA_ORIENTATION=+
MKQQNRIRMKAQQDRYIASVFIATTWLLTTTAICHAERQEEEEQKHQQYPPEEERRSHLLRHRNTQASTTCTFDGVIFQAGESLGDSFITRCGSASEWPCYCSPGKNPPVECPYCSMADSEKGLVCARNGESVSIINLNGISQTCSCSVNLDGTPEETCYSDQSTVDDNIDNDSNGDFCTIETIDGSTMTFENGEALGEFLPTRCSGGSAEFPCFCNTALSDQVDCPYCTWVDYKGDLICARELESVVYENSPGEFVECGCLRGFLSSCKLKTPTSPDVGTDVPTSSPTKVESTSSPTVYTSIPSVAPTNSITSSIPQTLGPTVTSTLDNTEPPTAGVPSSLSTVYPSFDDKESVLGSARPLPGVPELEGCLYVNIEKGTIDFVAEGASFGSVVQGPCSPTSDWPVYCNPAVPNGGMEYPYCVFETESTLSTNRNTATGQDEFSDSRGFICARSEERVLVSRADGTTEECSCLYFNPLLGPTSSCAMIAVNISLSSGESPYFHGGPTPVPTDNGDSDSLPTSQTSPGEEDPANSVSGASRTCVLSLLSVLGFCHILTLILNKLP